MNQFSWRQTLTLGLREFRQLKSVLFLMVINLSWGLTGYLALSTLQDSLRGLLQGNAKKVLSADIAISTRRIFNGAELESVRGAVKPFDKESQMLEMFSMVAAGEESRLVQVRGIDNTYPLYGDLKLRSGAIIDSASAKKILNEPVVWVYPEILNQLQVNVGDTLELGGQKFVIDDVIDDDTTQTFRAASLAPKIYVGTEPLRQTNLIQFGSTMSHTLFFRLPEGHLASSAKKSFLTKVDDSSINAKTYLDAAEDTGRFLNYLFDYLGLGALVGVSLSAFGMAALIRSWLNQKIRHYAIYNSVGLQPNLIRRVFLLQLTLMSAATAIFSLLVANAGLPAISYLLKDWVPADLVIALSWETAWKGFLLIWLGALAIALPSIQQLKEIPTSQLFSETASFQAGLDRRNWIWWMPVFIGFWILSVREANSLRLGTVFFGTLVASYAALGFIGWGVFKGFERMRGSWWTRQAFLYLGRRPALLSTFLALSIGSLLTTLIPQIRAGLHEELAGSQNQDLPALFLFDIQDEQIEPIKEYAAKANIKVNNISPLIRARILSINNVPYERVELGGNFQTREQEEDARMRNRGINLSYRGQLYESESIVRGREFSKEPSLDEPIELSVEQWYAERLGLKLGDTLIFDVQGVELPGRVINLRKVHWNRFEPNFFILVHPSALPDAPRIWLANIPKLDQATKNRIQTDLAKQFPNVSSVDVERVVAKALQIIGQMTVALQFMAGLAWVSGLFVLLALLYRQVSLQKWDANLYRLLGASKSDLFKVFQTQLAVLVLSSVILGTMLSLLVSWFMASRFFDGIFAVDWLALVATTVILSGISLLFTLAFSFYLARQNPAGVLQEVRL